MEYANFGSAGAPSERPGGPKRPGGPTSGDRPQWRRGRRRPQAHIRRRAVRCSGQRGPMMRLRWTVFALSLGVAIA